MFNTEFLLKLINKNNISKYVYTVLLFSIVTVFDFLTLYIFGSLIGIYLYLSIITLLSFTGVIIVISLYKKNLIQLQKKHDAGIYPEKEFHCLTGLLFVTFLVIFPGIISSALGYIFLIPYFKNLIGRVLSKRLNLDWNAVYEYMEICS
ncbi:MAG: FxsA family protein [Spirochaetales bacterium]|nr:FxsA family protein [Spirochaetales bacterium]